MTYPVEIPKASDRIDLQSQQHANSAVWTQSAQDAYKPESKSDSGVVGFARSVGREIVVFGGGTVGGAVLEAADEIKNRPGQFALKAAESIGIGFALTATQAGPWWLKGAGRLAAATMGAHFMSDMMDSSRFKGLRGVWSDTWKSGDNLERNFGMVQRSAGHLLYDVGFMALGAKAGAKGVEHGLPLLKSMGAAKLLESGRGSLAHAETVPALAEMRQLHTDVRSLPADHPLSKAHEIMQSSKGKFTANSLAEMAEVTRKSEMKRAADSDRIATTIRDTDIPELVRRNAQHEQSVGQLGKDLVAKKTELANAESLVAESRAFDQAQRKVEALEADGQGLGAKKAELRALEEQLRSQTQAKGEGKKHGQAEDGAAKGKEGKKGDTEAAPKEDLGQNVRDLRKQVKEIETATDTKNQDSSLNKAIRERDAAKLALEAAQTGKTERVAQVRTEMDGIQGQIEAHKRSQTEIVGQIDQLATAYHNRVAEIVGDPTKAIQPDPAEVKVAKPVRTDAQAANKTTDGAGKEAVVAKTEVTGEQGKGAPAGDRQGTARVEARKAQPEVTLAEVARLEAQSKIGQSFEAARPVVTEVRTQLETIKKAEAARKQGAADLAAAERELGKIESGKKTFADEAAKQLAVTELQAKQQKAREDMTAAQETVKRTSTPYFRSAKLVRDYAAAAEKYMSTDSQIGRQSEVARDVVKNLEAMMDDVPTLRRGADQHNNGLSRRGRPNHDLERLTEIREHLDRRLENMTAKHEARNQEVLAKPTVKTAFDLVRSGQLKEAMPEYIRANLEASRQRILEMERPQNISERAWQAITGRVKKADVEALANDPTNIEAVLRHSTTVFFDNAGKLVSGPGRDGRQLPKYFDTAQVMKGDGRGGAGIDRLQGDNPAGSAVIAPKVRLSFDGKLELNELHRRGGARDNAKPVYAKDVVRVDGTVPPGVEQGTSLGALFKYMNGAAPKKAARDGGKARTAPPPEATDNTPKEPAA